MSTEAGDPSSLPTVHATSTVSPLPPNQVRGRLSSERDGGRGFRDDRESWRWRLGCGWGLVDGREAVPTWWRASDGGEVLGSVGGGGTGVSVGGSVGDGVSDGGGVSVGVSVACLCGAASTLERGRTPRERMSETPRPRFRRHCAEWRSERRQEWRYDASGTRVSHLLRCLWCDPEAQRGPWSRLL
jgi:hypothetical protein